MVKLITISFSIRKFSKSNINITELKKAEAAIRAIATKHGITEDEVRKEMTIAIESGYNNPDPAVRAYWQNTPFHSRKPSPEEFLVWCAAQM